MKKIKQKFLLYAILLIHAYIIISVCDGSINSLYINIINRYLLYSFLISMR